MTESHTKLNKGTKTGADKAAEHLPALTRAYGRALRAAGRRAAARMRQTATVTAAAEPNAPPPGWVPPPADSLINQQELADDTQAKTAKLHKQMLTASASSALHPFDISFDVRAPTSQAILDGYAARIQQTITSAISEQVTEAIQDGYANGYSVDKVARNIVSKTNEISSVRADMLARSDLNGLSNAGSLLGATTADAAATKTWLATEDERTRETHSDADGQTVGINDTFDVGGESAMYPGDPNLSWEESANCRCTVVYGQPLTASSPSLEAWRDNLWEGSALSLVASSHADAVTSGGDMSRTGIEDQQAPTIISRSELKAITAAATGDTGLPLSERDRAWDAGEATGRVKKWASSDGSGDPDKIDFGKLARAYFWQDPAGDGGAKIGDFKLPFADIIGGKLTAVWRGVTAGAQRLSQTQGIDKGAVQKKMSAYYSKAAKQFDDKTITPPWANGKASVDGERLAAVRTFLADNGADVIEDDELRAIILVAESFASNSKHRYAGNGGACKICGMAPGNKDAHFGAETITASLENFALLAAVDGGTPWTATLCVAGVPTVDSGVKRLLSPDGGSWLPLPLPLMLMDDGPHADVVTDAPICGRIDTISVAGNAYQATGVLFDDSDDADVRAAGAKAAALVGEMRRLGISIDMVDCEWDVMAYSDGAVQSLDDAFEETMDEANDPTASDSDYPGGPATEADPDDPGEAQGDADNEIELIYCATQWVIAGATICPVQAINPLSTISLLAAAAKHESKWYSETEFVGPVLTASAAGLAPELPPAEWFADPKLSQLTALTVTDEGRVFGHMAPWDGCHTGFPGTCVAPPRSPSNYAGFHLGELRTADGERVAVGTLTMDTGHAGHRLSADKAIAHYDNTGTAAAFVHAGEDAFGIWVAGTLSADLSAADAQKLMASKPSGDWREVFRGRGRDLIGVLQVNVPGFPVPRALVASGLLPDGGDAVQFVESPECLPCAESLARELAVLAASVDGIEGLAQLVA